MKKVLLLLILILPMVSAQPQIILQHEEVQPQEIILGEIPASNFLTTLESSDLKFYQDNKQVFFEHELFFYNNTKYGPNKTKPSNVFIRQQKPKYEPRKAGSPSSTRSSQSI